MNLRKSLGLEDGVKQLTFEIRPQSIDFQGKVTPLFVLYLEKGVQVLGQFQSDNKHNLKDTFYRFKMPQPAPFRVKNFGHATYTWNFYRVNSTDSAEELEDSINFNMKKAIEDYYKELEQKYKQVQTYIKDKSLNHAVILQAWNRAKKQMRKSRINIKSIFPKLQMHLQFQLNILNPLDLELRLNSKRLRKSKSESSSQKNQKKNISLDQSRFFDIAIGINENQVTKIIQQARKQRLGSDQVTNIIKNISSSPQLHGEQTKNANEQTKVTIMNPSGKLIQNNNEEDGEINAQDNQKLRTSPTQGQEGNQLYIPNKRFSTLSDIVERSHEGSSTYDYGKFSYGKNDIPDRIDEIVDRQSSEKDNKNMVTQLLNKFKTLPNQKSLKKADNEDLRRVQTSQKSRNVLQVGQYRSEMANRQYSEYSQTPNIADIPTTSGDSNAKYIIAFALLIIFIVLGKEIFFDCQGKNCQRLKKAPKTKKTVKTS